MKEKEGLKPIFDKNIKIIILGTSPGNRSLKEKNYYQHKNNNFWKVIGFSLGIKNFEKEDYKTQIKILKKNNIGLWDVFKKFKGESSSDNQRDFLELNDFTIFQKFKSLKVMILNGRSKKSIKNYKEFINKFREDYIIILLPSTSGLNFEYPLPRQKRYWKKALKSCIKYSSI